MVDFMTSTVQAQGKESLYPLNEILGGTETLGREKTPWPLAGIKRWAA